MNRIIYIHQYFKTPKEGGAVRSYYLARGLVENGYTVDMITSHNGSFYETREIDGIRVHYLPVKYTSSMGFFRRIISFLMFAWRAYKYAIKLPRPDLCYATSTPLTVGLTAMWLKRKIGVPYYFEVRDLWPEAPIQMGVIRNPILKRVLYGLERKIYRNAEKIIALSPGIRDSVLKASPGKKVYLIPNMADTSFFRTGVRSRVLEKKYRVEGKFVITYFGAIGKVNHLEYLLDLVRVSKEKSLNLHFLIMGDGNALKSIRIKAENLKLESFISFIPPGDKEAVRDILDITDATYISFANKSVLQHNSPNKFFDSIASGKLVILNVGGWLNDLISHHNCGFYVDPERPDHFVGKITPYLEDRTRMIAAQHHARSLAELFYSRELQVQKLLKVLDPEFKMTINEDQVYTLTA